MSIKQKSCAHKYTLSCYHSSQSLTVELVGYFFLLGMFVLESLQGHLSQVQFFKTFLKLSKDVSDLLIPSEKTGHNCNL